MKKYKGFQVGETVQLLVDYVDREASVSKGVKFKIVSFPPCTIPERFTHFIYGLTPHNNAVRVFPNEVKKVSMSKIQAKRYLNRYFKGLYIKENDDEFKALVRLLDKVSKSKTENESN